MSYTITTVAEMMGRINKTLYIPGIQRPYVWEPEQIIRLFDSLMRRYPIGTLLLWNLPAANRGDWKVYRFIENFWSGEIHNDEASVPEDRACTLVLDGQQRLTSLLVGLKGTYTVKKKFQRRRNADAWSEIALHIDLAHAAESDDDVDDEDNPLAEHYRFQFFPVDEKPRNKLGELWFEVSFIMSASDEAALERIEQSWIENNTQLSPEQKAIARENLRRLWEMVWRDDAIAYFTESTSSYDRVLDIFIRANDGGTRLSREDLLMSVITLRWQQFNARGETESLIAALTDQLQPKRAIQRKFLLRSALFLNNLNFTIQVKNFTPANIALLEETWDEVKQSLLFAARWLREKGLYGECLTSINVAMLLAYYFKHSGVARGETALSEENAERIRQWVIAVQFQGLMGTQVNSTLADFRNVIRRTRDVAAEFPVQEIGRIFSKRGRQYGFNEEWVDRFCSHELNGMTSEKLLSLLYGKDLAVHGLKPVPLVQPRFFMPEELRRAGLPDALHPSVQQHANKLVLSVALNEHEANQYYSLPFEQWVQTLTREQLAQHHLPEEMVQEGLRSLPELINQRKKLIARRLTAQLPELTTS